MNPRVVRRGTRCRARSAVDRPAAAGRTRARRPARRPEARTAAGSVTTRSGVPSCQPPVQRRSGRQVASIAFARAVRDPALKDCDLRVGQRIQTDELVARRIRFPRRHDAILRDERHLRRVRSRLAYVSRLNGADPPGWWHWAHLLKTTGATSFEKVTWPNAGAGSSARTARTQGYLLVHQSVTAEITRSVQSRAMANKRQKRAFFCRNSVVRWAFSAVYWMDVLRQFRAFITHRMTGESL